MKSELILYIEILLIVLKILLISSLRLLKVFSQDKEDDLKVGVKSTALRFGDFTKKWISGFGVACISGLALSGYNADIGILCPPFDCRILKLPLSTKGNLLDVFCIGLPYYAFLAAASGQLAWQILTVDLSSRADCNRK